jgi:hypothetical protein
MEIKLAARDRDWSHLRMGTSLRNILEYPIKNTKQVAGNEIHIWSQKRSQVIHIEIEVTPWK